MALSEKELSRRKMEYCTDVDGDHNERVDDDCSMRITTDSGGNALFAVVYSCFGVKL